MYLDTILNIHIHLPVEFSQKHHEVSSITHKKTWSISLNNMLIIIELLVSEMELNTSSLAP